MKHLMAASITCHTVLKQTKGNKTRETDFATIILLHPDHTLDERVEVDLNSDENTNEHYKPSRPGAHHDNSSSNSVRGNVRSSDAYIQARAY